jgi:hypothetical protein
VNANVVYFDLGHVKLVGEGKKTKSTVCCLAFLIAFLEASQAIRDEESGASCKGRRDAHGRLINTSAGGLKKLFHK